MWRVDRSDNEPGLHLARVVNGTMSFEFLTIQSPSPDGSGILDDAASLRWQSEYLSKLNSKSKIYEYSPETLYGKSLTFYCVDIGEAGKQAVPMFCKPRGTDWRVIYGGIPKYLQEVKDILKSIE